MDWYKDKIGSLCIFIMYTHQHTKAVQMLPREQKDTDYVCSLMYQTAWASLKSACWERYRQQERKIYEIKSNGMIWIGRLLLVWSSMCATVSGGEPVSAGGREAYVCP